MGAIATMLYGFDSRYTFGMEHPPDLTPVWSAREEKRRGIDSGLDFIGRYRRHLTLGWRSADPTAHPQFVPTVFRATYLDVRSET